MYCFYWPGYFPLNKNKNKIRMSTDYAKLNRFDVLAVVLVFIGLVIVGCEIFIALPQQQKLELSQAVMIMDLHEQAAQQVEIAIAVLDSVDKFYSETYIAFGEVWDFPGFIGDWADRTNRTIASIGSVSDAVATGYARSNVAYWQEAPENGMVLGTSIQNVFEEGTIKPPLEAFTEKLLPVKSPVLETVRQVKNNLDY